MTTLFNLFLSLLDYTRKRGALGEEDSTNFEPVGDRRDESDAAAINFNAR